ncbi:hypothetical protein WG66_016760 [Moniliophthora roreri]|nr:hypothetical protein WG66_016760 [Moniliophthora roreri]
MVPGQRSSVTRIVTLQGKALLCPSFCDTSPVSRMSTHPLSEKAPRKDSKYTQGALFLVLQVEAVEGFTFGGLGPAAKLYVEAYRRYTPRPSLPYESLEIVFVRTPRIPISSPWVYRFGYHATIALKILL